MSGFQTLKHLFPQKLENYIQINVSKAKNSWFDFKSCGWKTVDHFDKLTFNDLKSPDNCQNSLNSAVKL